MLSQSQIMRLATVMMLSEFLLNYQVVAGLPFVIPRIGRHSEQSQRLIKEVQNIDFQAEKSATLNHANAFQVVDWFNLIASNQELARSNCEPGFRDAVSFRLCCQGKNSKSKALISWCNSKTSLTDDKKEKLITGKVLEGDRKHQLWDKMSPQDSKALLNWIVEDWAERMRAKRSVGLYHLYF